MIEKIYKRIKLYFFRIFLLIFSPILLIPIFFLKLFYKFKKINISYLIIENRYFGHMALNTELSMIKYNNHKYFGCFETKESCNTYLENIIKQNISILKNRVFYFSLKLLEILPRFITNYFNFLKFGNLREFEYLDLLNNKNINLNFTSSKSNLNKLSRFAINQNDNFVCISIRDSYFHENLYGQKSQEYRNFEIDDYIPVIDYLINLNFKVIRLGSSNKKINYENTKFIDYACSKYKSDFLDIYFIKNCKALLTTSMGIQAVGMVFRKKILVYNKAPWQTLESSYQNCWILPSKLISKIDDTHLDLLNILKINYIPWGKKHFDNLKIDVLSHSNDDILKSTIEFFESEILGIENPNQLSRSQIFWNNFRLNINKKFSKAHTYKAKLPSIFLDKFI